MMRLLMLLLVACSSSSSKTPVQQPPPPPQNVAGPDACTTAVDKLFGLITRKGGEIEPGQREATIEDCQARPGDATVACVNAAKDDAAIEACMKPRPKGEPVDQLDAATEQLRTYFFVHETFTDHEVALTPAKPCCQFPSKKCPPEAKVDSYLTDILKLDFSTERAFQYRFEATGNKAVLEAVGDRDCDGTTVTHRRELEQRADGKMHITVNDPPAEKD